MINCSVRVHHYHCATVLLIDVLRNTGALWHRQIRYIRLYLLVRSVLRSVVGFDLFIGFVLLNSELKYITADLSS